MREMFAAVVGTAAVAGFGGGMLLGERMDGMTISRLAKENAQLRAQLLDAKAELDAVRRGLMSPGAGTGGTIIPPGVPEGR